MPVDKFGRMSDAKTRDTGVSLTYINNNYIRSDGSTPVSGSINMNGNTLYNVSDPVNPRDVATKECADKVGGGVAAIVKTRPGNYGAIGNIDMRGYTLTNVLDPAEAQDVATKQYADKTVNNVDRANKKYVDDVTKAVKSNVKDELKGEFRHLIAAHASYHGDLIKDKYQFTFAGNKAHDSTTGFLVPHLGRIRKIKLRTPISKESFENVIFKRDRVDVDFINKGFFVFTNKKLILI